jgi:glycosyltransferase involved in cell wall biosynthesis
MRILQVSSGLGLGGGETHVLELVGALREHGHDVTLAGRRDSEIRPDIHLPFLNSADMFTAWKLRRLLKRHQFDVVHAHVARDYTPVAAAAWGIPRLKVIMTRHLLFPVRPHFLYQRVDGWIAPTSQILKSLAPLHPKASAVIPNWVNLSKFAYRPQSTTRRPVQLGLLGQVSPHKGHEDALEALRLLGSDYRLLIGGRGEDAYVQSLRQRAQDLPAEFLGFVSLPEFFGMVDILLVPSWEEPFGIVLLEAMASGVPVITTSAGGPLDIVRSGKDGVLIPPRNPVALAAAVRQLAGNRQGRIEMTRSARARVEQDFDIQKVIPKIEAFYVG